jgi:membrane protein required for colicin V production
MNTIDIIILIPLIYFAYKGFVNGLIYEVASILALVAGVYLSMNFSYITQDYIQKDLNFQSEYISIISFVITFILVVLCVHIVAKFMTKIIKLVALGPFNNIGGAIFGAFKIFVIIAVLLSVVGNFIDVSKTEMFSDSKLYPTLKSLSDLFFDNIDKLITK